MKKKLHEQVTLLRGTVPECKFEVVKITNLLPASWELPDDVTNEIVIRDFFSVSDHITSKVTISRQPKGYSIEFTLWVRWLYPKDVDALFDKTPPSHLRENLLVKSGVIKDLYDFLGASFSKVRIESKVICMRDFIEIAIQGDDRFSKFTLRIEFFILADGFAEVLNILSDFQKLWRQEKEKKTFVDEKYNASITKAWMRTIFAQFENEALKEALEDCAKEIDCTVRYGEPSSPDIIAVPYFVAIIDRAILGADSWALYLDYLNEADDNTPCIIIDNSNAFACPNNEILKDKKWFHFDMNDRRSISEIVATVKKIRMGLKKEVLKNPKENWGGVTDCEPFE